jgi:hypothetical protein
MYPRSAPVKAMAVSKLIQFGAFVGQSLAQLLQIAAQIVELFQHSFRNAHPALAQKIMLGAQHALQVGDLPVQAADFFLAHVVEIGSLLHGVNIRSHYRDRALAGRMLNLEDLGHLTDPFHLNAGSFEDQDAAGGIR